MTKDWIVSIKYVNKNGEPVESTVSINGRNLIREIQPFIRELIGLASIYHDVSLKIVREATKVVDIESKV